MTNERIFVTLNASFTDVEKCRSAMETIVANAHAAYGVDSHFWFQSDDGKSLFVIEQYEDKKALNQAVRRFTRARFAFFQSITDISISVYGEIARFSRFMFSALSPTYFDFMSGYSTTDNSDKEIGITELERNRTLVITKFTHDKTEEIGNSMTMWLDSSRAQDGYKTLACYSREETKETVLIEQYSDQDTAKKCIENDASHRSEVFNGAGKIDAVCYGLASSEISQFIPSTSLQGMPYFGGYSK